MRLSSFFPAFSLPLLLLAALFTSAQFSLAQDTTDAAAKQAQELLAEAKKLAPNLTSTSGNPNLAEARLQAETRNKMQDLFDQAIKVAPDYPEAFLARAAFRKRNNDIFGAQVDFLKAQQLAPKRPEILLELSTISGILNDSQQAQKYAEEGYQLCLAAAKANQQPAVPVPVQARLAFQAQRWQDVIAACDVALRSNQNPDSKELFKLRGLSHLALGNEGPAMPDLVAADAVGPEISYYEAQAPTKDAASILALAQKINMTPGEGIAALNLLDLAIKKDPQLAEAYLERAQIRWTIRKRFLDFYCKFRTRSDRMQDFQLAQLHTAAKILDDCAAAERLGIAPEKLSAIRQGIADTSFLAQFEFTPYPLAIHGDLADKRKSFATPAKELLDIARQARTLSVPVEERILFYDKAIEKDPKKAVAYFERAQLRWLLVQELEYIRDLVYKEAWESAKAQGVEINSGFFAENKLPARIQEEVDVQLKPIFQARDYHTAIRVRDDCTAAAKLGFTSPELTALVAAVNKKISK